MPFADNRHAAKAQRKWLAAHALPEEKAVVEVYRRQEDRIGRSRRRKVAISKNGEVIVGYVSDAEPSIVNFTDHGLAGKRAKRPWLVPVPESGGCWHGVGDLPEDCQAAMQAVRAVYQAEGFTVAAKGMDRVPQGGHAYAPPEPTVAEGWVHWMDDGTESDWSESQPGTDNEAEVERLRAAYLATNRMADAARGPAAQALGLLAQKAYAAYTAAVRAGKWFGKGSCESRPELPEAVRAAYDVKVGRRKRRQRIACRLMSEQDAGYSEMVDIDAAFWRPTLAFAGTGVEVPRTARKQRSARTYTVDLPGRAARQPDAALDREGTIAACAGGPAACQGRVRDRAMHDPLADGRDRRWLQPIQQRRNGHP